MMYLLLVALYVGLIASTFALLFADLAAGWIFLVFSVVASVGGALFQRARIIAASFLLASLIVLFAGLFGMCAPRRNGLQLPPAGA